MSISRNWTARICALGLMLSAGACALASFQDATIVIDHALNSPTLTVRYAGAHVALVELRINGTSFGTRNTDSSLSKGETNFTIDLSNLSNGDNSVEVRLYDKDGKLLGSEQSNVTASDGVKAPVYLQMPKNGSTVQGPLQISVGFGKDLHNSYVSFFIDNQFKAMTNSPPYEYIWDTTRDANGWHDVEAWVVDDSSTTYKTRKVKVYVNNPGGNTYRQFTEPATPAVKPQVSAVSPVAVTKTLEIATPKIQSIGHAIATADVTKPAAHGTSILPEASPLQTDVGSAAGVKTEGLGNAIATGPRMLLPTGKRVAESNLTPALSGPISPGGSHMVRVGDIASPRAVPYRANRIPTLPKVGTTLAVAEPSANSMSVANKAGTPAKIEIGHGTKLPNIGAFDILLNAKTVKFDSVKPRVEDNVPLTPFRYLFEQSGGKVDWTNRTKTVNAEGQGREIYIRIGDKLAKVNNLPVQLDLTPFIDHGRTIVPLSFIRDALDVEVDYDPVTNHVLITSVKKGSGKT